MIATIPIRNLYFLLCYAWNTLDEANVIEVGGLEFKEVSDLFARILINGTNHLVKRGLDRDYLPRSEDIACVRGKIDIGTSARRLLMQQGKVHCHFDELDHNVMHNRILRATIRCLACAEGLDRHLRTQLIVLYRRLNGIEDINLNRFVFNRIQLHRNIAFYGFLMNVCELVSDSLLAEDGGGTYRFRDFTRDENRMAKVYEKFVGNFFRREQRDYKVRSQEGLRWEAEADNQEARNMLPKMAMDVVLRSSTRTIVVETKYYKEAFVEYYGKKSINSHHLYQLFSYLKNLEQRGKPDRDAEGILLYPTVERAFDYRYRIQGHTVRVTTLDLNRDWKQITKDLLDLLRKDVPRPIEAFESGHATWNGHSDLASGGTA